MILVNLQKIEQITPQLRGWAIREDPNSQVTDLDWILMWGHKAGWFQVNKGCIRGINLRGFLWRKK